MANQLTEQKRRCNCSLQLFHRATPAVIRARKGGSGIELRRSTSKIILALGPHHQCNRQYCNSTHSLRPRSTRTRSTRKGANGPFTRSGGEGGIRTLDELLTHTPLAGERLRPLGHLSGKCKWCAGRESNPRPSGS